MFIYIKEDFVDLKLNKDKVDPTILCNGFASMCFVNILICYQDFFFQTNVTDF